jgi:hypothetical protein
VQLFGRVTKKDKAKRGAGKPGADRLDRELAITLRDARKTDPEFARRVLEARLGLKPAAPVDAVDGFLSMFERFRAVIPEVRELERPDGPDWGAIANGVASAFLAMQQQSAAAAAARSAAPRPAAVAPPRPPPAPPPPAAGVTEGEYSPVPPVAPIPPTGEPMVIPGRQVPGPADLRSIMAAAMLAGKLPPDAAAVILEATSSPEMRALVDEVCRLEDGQLWPYLEEFGRRVPHMSGLCRWLSLPEYRPWTLAVVAELRAATAAAA